MNAVVTRGYLFTLALVVTAGYTGGDEPPVVTGEWNYPFYRRRRRL